MKRIGTLLPGTCLPVMTVHAVDFRAGAVEGLPDLTAAYVVGVRTEGVGAIRRLRSFRVSYAFWRETGMRYPYPLLLLLTLLAVTGLADEPAPAANMENLWQISVADNYDLEGKLWRTSEAHGLNYYEVPVHWSTLEVYYDLKAQRFLVSGMDNRRNPYRFTDSADPREFSPNALNYYIR